MATTSYYFLSAPGAPLETTKETQLLRVALAVNAGKTMEDLTDILFDSLDGTVPFDRIGIALLLPGDILTIAHVRSKRPIVWGKGASAPLAGTSLEPIVREHRIRIINDLEAYSKDHPQSKTTSLILKEGMRASLTLPLSTSKGVVGLMFFSSSRPFAYSTEHVDFLRSLAAALGTAFERAQLLDELRRSNDRLKSLDELKTNFLSNLSHELRTPLTAVIANAYALEDQLADSSSKPYLDAVIQGGERLKSLLNDLFDYTALEAGHFPLSRVPMELGALLREVVEEARPRIIEKGLSLDLHVPTESVVIEGDAPRLAQVFRALIDNACKFTPAPGQILITLQVKDHQALVEVIDSGIGIPPEAQDHVFEKFFQVDSGPARSYGGVGLGLALTKAIVTAHNGIIMLRSIPGEGSKMSVYLPLLDVPEGDSAPPTP